jgi:hypothetical protein
MNTKDPKGYYAILGVHPNADLTTIKAAFRRRGMELHPDRNKSPNATSYFQLLNEAYGVLSDPAARAHYDTMALDGPPHAAESVAANQPPEPIVCSCCGKVTAQPRYTIFYEVKSFIVLTIREPVQGIFCSECAATKALKASAITWLFGWWGFPWGPIYSLQAIFTNMFGGRQPQNVNARLAAYQARVFAALGKTDIARAIALDALAVAKKIGSGRPKGDAIDEGVQLRAQIENFLELLGNRGSGNRLKNAWSLFRRPFYTQAAIAFFLFGWLGYFIETAPASQPLKGPKPYVATPQSYAPQRAAYSGSATAPWESNWSGQQPQRRAYQRPETAPNGQSWPVGAGYVNGFQQLHSSGLSKVTVDNSQNGSDVFVKLVSLDGSRAYPARIFFIPAYSSFVLSSVTAGKYDIRYRNLDTGGLSRSEAFSLEEIKTYEGTRFSEVTLTLYKVRNGNMQTYGLDEGEF